MPGASNRSQGQSPGSPSQYAFSGPVSWRESRVRQSTSGGNAGTPHRRGPNAVHLCQGQANIVPLGRIELRTIRWEIMLPDIRSDTP